LSGFAGPRSRCNGLWAEPGPTESDPTESDLTKSDLTKSDLTKSGVDGLKQAPRRL
jgi:hypothetical protein